MRLSYRVGLGNCVVPGQAAFWYSLMRPSHRVDPECSYSRCRCLWWLVTGLGRSLVEGSVGPVLVVVGDVVDDEPFELAVVPDDGAVEELSSDRSDPTFIEGVGDRCTDGRVRRILKPSVLKTSSKASMNWLPRS